jgi:glycosyltransferase involved in cell wall biosynthesis
MNVIYISYDGMTDPLGQSQVIPYLIGLTKKGHNISIISCEKINKFEKHQSFIKKLLDVNNIDWYPVPYSTLPSLLSKQINLLRIQHKANQLCKINIPDIVHCRSYMAALIGMKLKYKFGVKFIFDMRGFWADERVDGSLWNLNKITHKKIYNFFKNKELEFLKNANHTISLTQNAKDEILSWSAIQNKSIPITIIPCCVDLNLFTIKNIDTIHQQNIKIKLNINSNDIVISYLGSIGTWYMLDEMLDFFKLFSAKYKNAKFLFITQDNQQHIFSIAERKGIHKEHLIIHSASRNEVPLYLSISHLSIYFIKQAYSKKASSPTKTGEIMAMGIPIITNSGIGDSDKIISESGAGALINSFTEKEYLKVIEQIDLLLKLDSAKIRDAAFKYFSLENGVELYDEVYRRMERG